jgi:hypothetical protein
LLLRWRGWSGWRRIEKIECELQQPMHGARV